LSSRQQSTRVAGGGSGVDGWDAVRGGAVEVVELNGGRPAKGRGYVELVGYDESKPVSQITPHRPLAA
jgi:hypothetical protein